MFCASQTVRRASPAAAQVPEPDGDAGMGAAEGSQQSRQVDHSEGLDRSDVQLAA
jgi:hypothetical protein